MKRLFWAIVHGSTVYFAISFLIGYISISPQQSKAETSKATIVKQAVRFEAYDGYPDPNSLLDQVNDYRMSNGLPKLVADPILAQEAKARADDMAQRHYYSHNNPDGVNFFDIMLSKGVAPAYACENLALEESAHEVVYSDSWKMSAPHNACILKENVSRAGYAVQKFYSLEDGAESDYFVVVAIHASE